METRCKIEVVVFGKVYSCPDEPASLRFIKSLKSNWDNTAEVRMVDPLGKYVARWSIEDFLK